MFLKHLWLTIRKQFFFKYILQFNLEYLQFNKVQKISGRLDLKGEEKFRHANKMNNYIVVGVFIITIVNVFVAAFSTGPPLSKTSE